MPLYRVREPFLWRGRVYAIGAVMDGSDLAVERNLVLFDPVPGPIVEQATAAPGERRSVRIPRKKET
jgi:hypothetical protein